MSFVARFTREVELLEEKIVLKETASRSVVLLEDKYHQRLINAPKKAPVVEAVTSIIKEEDEANPAAGVPFDVMSRSYAMGLAFDEQRKLVRCSQVVFS